MRCPHCGSELSEDLRVDFCPSCGGRLDEATSEVTEEPELSYEFSETGQDEIPLFTGEPSEPEREEPYYCLWEDRDRVGFVSAWWETTKTILLRPTEFYGNLPPTGRLGDAFLFAVIWLLIGGFVQGLYGMLFQGIGFLAPLLTGGFGEGFGAGTPADYLGGFAVIVPLLEGVICAPILGCIGIVITAGILHLILMLFGGTTQPFEATLRVICYASVNNLFAVIPLCGALVSFVYWIVLAIIGLREVHQCTMGKAAIAVLLPLLLCILCLCAPFFVLFSVGFLGTSAGIQ